MRENGIGYKWLPECGGKTKPIPADLAYGIRRILEISAEMRTAIMCSESQPLTKHKILRANCHRVGLLAPSKIHFVSALPKTRNAKVMRRVIRAAYLGEDAGDLSALENPNTVEEIKQCVDE